VYDIIKKTCLDHIAMLETNIERIRDNLDEWKIRHFMEWIVKNIRP
jgi:hypothetical protein